MAVACPLLPVVPPEIQRPVSDLKPSPGSATQGRQVGLV